MKWLLWFRVRKECTFDCPWWYPISIWVFIHGLWSLSHLSSILEEDERIELYPFSRAIRFRGGPKPSLVHLPIASISSAPKSTLWVFTTLTAHITRPESTSRSWPSLMQVSWLRDPRIERVLRLMRPLCYHHTHPHLNFCADVSSIDDLWFLRSHQTSQFILTWELTRQVITSKCDD